MEVICRRMLREHECPMHYYCTHSKPHEPKAYNSRGSVCDVRHKCHAGYPDARCVPVPDTYHQEAAQ